MAARLKMPPRDRIAAFKPLVFVVCLLPLAHLVWDALHGTLGTDPVAQLEHRSGDWALRLLLATLAITPLRKFTGWHKAIRFRRMLGLFAFFYVSVHLTIYLAIDLGGYWADIFEQIAKKPYITVGFAAWLLLIPLALTSTQGAMRRLGRKWQRLHRLVYLIALLGVLHYFWLVKADHREPALYLAIWIVLMLARLPLKMRVWRRPPVDAAVMLKD
ncbi:MAG TPA: protein-methionine-sulfoxide reductase heme-binding subunit MsrQ [Rudaea sp.]|nr:protein-methionine-sulfoxide reductase heme-binding subunit MsrQ [Rudaea sp.]